MLKNIFFLLAGLLAGSAVAAPAAENTKTLFVSSGCFWCTEHDFEGLPGVVDVSSVYINGREDITPTYAIVSSGKSGYVEAVRITYDPAKTELKALLNQYWKNVDPVDAIGQFCDKGSQYRAGLYYQSEEEQAVMKQSLQAAQAYFKAHGPIAVQIKPLSGKVTLAEDYHQNYAEKNPFRYKYYRGRCGRDERLKELNSSGFQF